MGVIVVGGVAFFKWNFVLSVTLPSYVTLGRSVHMSGHEVPHFSSRDNNSPPEIIVVIIT